jgi:ABC-type dipeptide/oligopeptide/nickel transport system permease subunit
MAFNFLGDGFQRDALDPRQRCSGAKSSSN